jgi:hypothetical protein
MIIRVHNCTSQSNKPVFKKKGFLLPMPMSLAGSMAKKPKLNIHLSISHNRHLRLNGSIPDSTAAM